MKIFLQKNVVRNGKSRIFAAANRKIGFAESEISAKLD